MKVSDIMLSLDPGPFDCLYRIRRDVGEDCRVIYVKVSDTDILPEDRRTYGPLVVKELGKLPGWDDSWNTLTVQREGGRIQCIFNDFSPPALKPWQILGQHGYVDVLKLPVVESVKNRVSRVNLGSELCFLKIARFAHEIGWLAQEIKAYHALAEHSSSSLAPRLLSYAFEETGRRVTGVLLEEVKGRFAGIDDLKACEEALQRLHTTGILHRDVNRHNIFITTEGPKFIDFEDSVLYSDIEPEEWETLKAEELDQLRVKLLNDSDSGRPWATDYV